jgi:hypothetical protein
MARRQGVSWIDAAAARVLIALSSLRVNLPAEMRQVASPQTASTREVSHDCS